MGGKSLVEQEVLKEPLSTIPLYSPLQSESGGYEAGETEEKH